jgi:hypothetical protein
MLEANCIMALGALMVFRNPNSAIIAGGSVRPGWGLAGWGGPTHGWRRGLLPGAAPQLHGMRSRAPRSGKVGAKHNFSLTHYADLPAMLGQPGYHSALRIPQSSGPAKSNRIKPLLWRKQPQARSAIRTPHSEMEKLPNEPNSFGAKTIRI